MRISRRVRLDEARAKERHDRQGDDVRREEGEHDRERERGEQEAADAVEKRDGKNTTALVSVAARTASATSWPPFSAATAGNSPSSMCRKMFSSTMTALSMSRETPAPVPPGSSS